MYRLMLIVCTIVGTLWAQQTPDSRKGYGEAVGDWNAGRAPEAKEKLAKVMERDPSYFRGYSLFWQSIARCDGEEARDDAIRQAMSRFAAVPAERRTEDFYS